MSDGSAPSPPNPQAPDPVDVGPPAPGAAADGPAAPEGARDGASNGPRHAKRDFRLFLSSHVSNELGGAVTEVALPLTAVVLLGATPMQVGVLAAADQAAFLLLGLPAGAWVDRMRSRTVMMAADAARVLLLASVPVAYLLGVLDMAVLVAVALLLGCARLFADVADHTYLPSLVGPDRLVQGNSRLEAVRSASGFAGPGIAGTAVQVFGAAGTLGANALTSLASLLFLGAIRTREPDPAPVGRTGLAGQIREGVAFLLGHRLLRLIVLETALINLFMSAIFAIEVLFLTRTVGLPPAVVGWMMAGATLGALVGAGVTGRLAAAVGQARLIWLSALVTMPFGLLLPLAAPDWRAGVYVLASAVLAAGTVCYNICQIAYRQRECPPELLGRMTATVRTIVWGVIPVSALMGGAVADLVGVREAVAVFAVAMALCPLVLVFSPLRRMRGFDDGEQGAAPEPEAGPGAGAGADPNGGPDADPDGGPDAVRPPTP
ncbi:MFS transporter [Nocardiopsis chromatogenes]|uniref:MFS transporter n=1 Tax=Nocardiopsis chromatogenes TaxID=280239 RepID=UPI000347D01E|nr:MFS transporter [Nocardiopsis chromatogenes]